MKRTCCCRAINYNVIQLKCATEDCSWHTSRQTHVTTLSTVEAVKQADFSWQKSQELLSNFESLPKNHNISTLSVALTLSVSTLVAQPYFYERLSWTMSQVTGLSFKSGNHMKYTGSSPAHIRWATFRYTKNRNPDTSPYQKSPAFDWTKTRQSAL